MTLYSFVDMLLDLPTYKIMRAFEAYTFINTIIGGYEQIKLKRNYIYEDNKHKLSNRVKFAKRY